MEIIEDRKRQILGAAHVLFVEKGFKETTLGEIARRAAISKGTLYYYYPTKDGLLVDLIETTGQDLIARYLQPPVAPGQPAYMCPLSPVSLTGFKELLAGAFEAMIRDEDFFRLGAVALLEALTGNEEIRAGFRRIYANWREFLASSLTQFKNLGLVPDSLDVTAVSIGLLAVTDGLFVQSYFDPDQVSPRTIGTLIGLLLKEQ